MLIFIYIFYLFIYIFLDVTIWRVKVVGGRVELDDRLIRIRFKIKAEFGLIAALIKRRSQRIT